MPTAVHRERRRPAVERNDILSMDFFADELADGRRFRALTVVNGPQGIQTALWNFRRLTSRISNQACSTGAPDTADVHCPSVACNITPLVIL